MNDAVISVEGLRKSYGPVEALRGIDLAVGRGGIVGILGPNGAGKTTLVETIEGLRTPTAGRVSVLGLDPAAAPREVRERTIDITNRLALRYAVTGAILHFLGAGVWGFAQTLPQINRWTHGTQITASHGHFAFFGAYAMLNLTLMAFAIPRLKGVRIEKDKLGMPSFSLMVFFIVMMVLALAVAGIVQVYFQRIMGLDYLSTQHYLKLWYRVFFVSALCFTGGAFLYIVDFLTLRRLRFLEAKA